jgi:hypothetical protein
VRRMLIALVGASLLFAGACGGDDDDGGLSSADGYNDELEQSFMSQCAPAAAGAPDPDGMCQCAYDKIVETIPFEEFQAYDEALREDPAAAAPAGLEEAITGCAAEAVPAP